MPKNTPTIGNLPGADLPVTFPVSGEERIVNMIVLLCEVQDAEMMAKYGQHLAPNAPTINALREKYELDWFFDETVRTWADCAAVMRHIHGVFTDHIRESRGN